MPKPNFDKIEPRDIQWVDDALSYFINNLNKTKYQGPDTMNGIKRMKKIKKILSDTTESEYDSNQWV